jgi:hypothetical protein
MLFSIKSQGVPVSIAKFDFIICSQVLQIFYADL